MSKIITVEEFPREWYEKIPVQKRNRKAPRKSGENKRDYKNIVCAFDIETTRVDEKNSLMYVWQFQIGTEYTIIGRTWDDFLALVKKLNRPLDLDTWLVVYVHNLSFEFQFLAGIYDFSPEEVFAVKSRRILKCDIRHLEFRCSYLHSNMSLNEFTKKMGAEHVKLDGVDFDYSKKRYPHTPLTETELQYAVHDVLGLVEALQNEMAADGDDLYSIPLTSTGYVRRDAKKALRKTPPNYIKDMLPTYPVYMLLREAFRGGNTHANRFYAGMILEDVKSADRSSSYPDVQINDNFPISPFMPMAEELTPQKAAKMIKLGKRCFLTRVALKNVRLRHFWWGCPYLSKDKSRNIVGGVYDNGRILSAEYLETTVTDVDFKIIVQEYDFDNCLFYDSYYARYGQLPPAYKDCIIEYYVKKTTLKGIEGAEMEYMRSKNKLNSIYGMTATDPLRIPIIFENGVFKKDLDVNPQEIIETSKAFCPYQWGVWTTAHARYRLEEGIALAGENFVYCDTDGVKYLGEIDWEKYNEERVKNSKANTAYATDPSGIMHYMGVYELERTYKTFKTLGAKKYGYTYEDGKTHVTIAGVNKKKGGEELDEFDGLESMEEGFIFHKAGGTELIYNDEKNCGTVEAEGHVYTITRNVTIKPSTYKLSLTDEYATLLALCNLASLKEEMQIETLLK